MADITITAANVLKGANAVIEKGVAGATVTAGQVVYRDAADGRYKLADCDSATDGVRVPRGIALNGASSGQPLEILMSGDITIGATLTLGATYYLSGNAGRIAPAADLATGDFPSVIGLATSTSVLKVNITSAGVAIP
jgi:hypothetical protein